MALPAAAGAVAGGGALLAGGLGLGAIDAAMGAPSGIDFAALDQVIQRRPVTSSAVEEQLLAQAALQLGASPESIADWFVVRRIEESSSPHVARKFLDNISTIRANLVAGNTKKANRDLKKLNRNLTQSGFYRSGGSAQYRIDGNNLVADVQDPTLTPLFDALRGEGEGIIADRVAAIQNISRAGAQPILTRGDIEGEEQEQIELQMAQLESALEEQKAKVIEQANKYGYSPAATLGEIGEQETLLQKQIQTEGGLSRALQLLTGQQQLTSGGVGLAQTALNPTLAGQGLQSLQAGSATDMSAASLGVQAAIASAQAEAAKQAGISNTYGGLLSTLLQAMGMGGGGGGQMSSTQTQEGLSGSSSGSSTGGASTAGAAG